MNSDWGMAVARIDVIMPQMGESIAEGTVSKWLKKVGDSIKRDEPIFEISTDKVDAEIPSPSAGTLAEILVTEGQTVPCRPWSRGLRPKREPSPRHPQLRQHPSQLPPPWGQEPLQVLLRARGATASGRSAHRVMRHLLMCHRHRPYP